MQGRGSVTHPPLAKLREMLSDARLRMGRSTDPNERHRIADEIRAITDAISLALAKLEE